MHRVPFPTTHAPLLRYLVLGSLRPSLLVPTPLLAPAALPSLCVLHVLLFDTTHHGSGTRYHPPNPRSTSRPAVALVGLRYPVVHRGRRPCPCSCWPCLPMPARLPACLHASVRIQPRHFSVWVAVPFGINSTSAIVLDKGFLTRLPDHEHGYPSVLPYRNGSCQFQAWERLPDSQSIDPAILSFGTPSNLYNI